MRITFQQVQKNVSEIANRESYNKDFIFELLAAYGRAAASITKLRFGESDLADDKENNVLQRNVVYFKQISDEKVLPTIDKLKKDPLVARYNPRYLIVTNYKQLAAIDTKKGTTLDIKIQDIDRRIDFFYGWTGDEVTNEKTEAVADRRAAEKMTDLYAEIAKVNKLSTKDSKYKHNLNVFFSRLLFCFFAEDTKVFSKEDSGIFTNSIKDFTQIDGGDLHLFLNTLFEKLDDKHSSKYTSPFSKFPYVNGSLFSKERHIEIPRFNAQARKILIECGSLRWDEINPDIFGSMFQGVVDEDYRSDHGMHYTSVPNIMKTIEPLFLDELREIFDKNYDNPRKLTQLHDRISKIKIFDPACGSGNFLIIAYKELRKLEHAIIERLLEGKLQVRLNSRISLNNFYGIEIDDFACEIATLSLHIAKHQMNIEFEKQFGKAIELIPLTDSGKIVCGNAGRLDWQEVCPNKPHYEGKLKVKQEKLIVDDYEQQELISEEDSQKVIWDEIHLIGNPPYQGARLQNEEQKADLKFSLRNDEFSGNLDYISLWFFKGVRYIKDTEASLSFVSTSSVCQGEHVGLLWSKLFQYNVEIGFAFRSFKWLNNAKKNAGVICLIIGIRNKSKKKKYIYDNGIRIEADNINGYLIDSKNIELHKRSTPISKLPSAIFGSMPNDGGYLLLTKDERNSLLDKHPSSSSFIKRYIGSEEFINGIERYCLWIDNDSINEALKIDVIKQRILNVEKNRRQSKRANTKDLAKMPYKFGEIRYKKTLSLIIPSVSSEKRVYLPIGYLDENYVISNLAFAVYDANLFVFGVLSSKMHVVWFRTVGGYLGTSFRYSSSIVYNNFPIPPLENEMRIIVETKAREILLIRENHSEKTLSEMYDPNKMPDDLKKAHHELDIAVDKLYRDKPYENDEERLSDLFALYEKMINEEKKRNAK